MRKDAGIAVHASRTAPPLPPFGRSLLTGTIAALFLSVIGALGTDAAPLLPRTGYWLVIMLTGSALGGGVAFTVQGWGRLRNRLFLEGALVSFLIAIPLTLVVTGAGMVVFADQLPPSPARLGWVFGAVLMVSALMTALGYATQTVPQLQLPVEPQKAPLPAPAAQSALSPAGAPPADALPPALLERLQPRLRSARLLALEAEDHYLRVHTDAGSDLVLLRLSDAIAETGALAGARCHRSWWVARDAVVGSARRGAGAILILETGLEVPVSRSNLPQLRADGWLRDGALLREDRG